MRAVIMAVLLTAVLIPGLVRAEATPSAAQPRPTEQPGDTPEATPASEPAQTVMFTMKPSTLQVVSEGSTWQVVAGENNDKVFLNLPSQEQARQAAEMLAFHGVTEMWEVSMPGEVEYLFVKPSGKSSGDLRGEQCTEFAPSSLTVTRFQGTYKSAAGEDVSYTQWSVDSGKRMMVRYNQKAVAQEVAALAGKYGCKKRCHLGDFWYFRQ